MNDNFAEMFWLLMIGAAVVGWVTIEGVIWIAHHISLAWI